MSDAQTTYTAAICRFYLLCGLLCTLLSGCTREPDIAEEKGQQILVSVRLSQSTQAPAPSAISQATEAAVHTLYALVFDENGNFRYGSPGVETSTGNFSIPLYTSSKPRLVYFVANYTVNEATLDIGASAAAIASLMEYTTANSELAIPMWGKYNFTQITTAEPTKAIELLRSMARFDVMLPNPIGGFTLEGAQAYRQLTNGRIIPSAATLNSGETSVNAPTLPATPVPAATTSPYPAAFAPYSDTDKGIQGSIYVNENTANDRLTATCIIVKATYMGVPCYYKLINGATASAGAFTYRPILRNTRYVMNITGVRGIGYPSVEEALNSEPVNIEYTIIEWTNAYQYIVFNDFNHFYAQAKSVKLGRNVLSNNTLAVESDVPVTEWELRFTNDHNGATAATTGNTMQNNRFKVEKAASKLTFTALRAYGDGLAAGESYNDTLIVKAQRLELKIAINQLNSQLDDWIDGGEDIIEELKKTKP